MKKFKKVYIEITNVCNLKCNFCPGTKRKQKFMSVSEFYSVAESVRPYTDYIYLHVMGEPLLHPNLKEILEIGRKFGFKIILTVNGTLIEKQKEILLQAEALHMVSVSLHSFEANDNDIEFDNYFKSIIEFGNDMAEKNKICSLRLWNIDGENTVGSNKLNTKIFLALENGFDLEYSIYEKMKMKRNITVRKYLYIETAEKFEWPDIEKKEVDKNCFCYGLREQIAVLVDGTVVPCCLDHKGDIAIGNIFDEDLGDIINSKRARNIYNGFNNRSAVEELCRKCGYVTRFNK